MTEWNRTSSIPRSSVHQTGLHGHGEVRPHRRSIVLAMPITALPRRLGPNGKLAALLRAQTVDLCAEQEIGRTRGGQGHYYRSMMSPSTADTGESSPTAARRRLLRRIHCLDTGRPVAPFCVVRQPDRHATEGEPS